MKRFFKTLCLLLAALLLAGFRESIPRSTAWPSRRTQGAFTFYNQKGRNAFFAYGGDLALLQALPAFRLRARFLPASRPASRPGLSFAAISRACPYSTAAVRGTSAVVMPA